MEQRTAISQRRAELDSQLLLLKNKLEIQYLNPKLQGEVQPTVIRTSLSAHCELCLVAAQNQVEGIEQMCDLPRAGAIDI